jgi:hypothetical protein
MMALYVAIVWLLIASISFGIWHQSIAAGIWMCAIANVIAVLVDKR